MKNWLHGVKSEKGVALLMVMVISAIVLAVMASMVYMLTSGTQISGLSKRFATATEAAIGGHDAARALIAVRGDDQALSQLDNRQFPDPDCLVEKLKEATALWDPACSNTSIIDPDDPGTYDFRYDLGGYRIHAKITSTVKGNSGVGGGSQKSKDYQSLWYIGAVHGGSGGSDDLPVVHIPYYYTVELDARSLLNPSERARLSMLYEY